MGYYMNTSFFYDEAFEVNKEVFIGSSMCIECMVDESMRDVFMDDLKVYKSAKGYHFSSP